jgi:DNA-binding response OmpR family regulator
MADQKTILIVDDEYFLAEMLKVRLDLLGYHVLLAESGEQALDTLKKETVDVVLMDVMMPVMSGWDATKAIKADEKTKAIPVIFMTALSRHDDHIKAHEVGGDDYISKPFEIQELVEKVKKWAGA